MLVDVEPFDPDFSFVNVMVLAALSKGASYGYELYNRVAKVSLGRLRVSESTIYKALTRLENDGFVETWEPEVGERRRYYEITERGWRLLRRDIGLLRRVADGIVGAKL